MYTSQDQLGGQQIMVPNGVTHLGVDDDYEGCGAASYVIRALTPSPRHAIDATCLVTRRLRGRCRPTSATANDLKPGMLAPADPVDRPVTAGRRPTSDVRELLDNADGTGLFDKGSFTETLAGWGKTVVAGEVRWYSVRRHQCRD